MDSLPHNELLNKDHDEGTEHEVEKSGFQPNLTILEALQANTSIIEALRKQVKDLQSKKKKAQTCVFIPSWRARKYRFCKSYATDQGSARVIPLHL